MALENCKLCLESYSVVLFTANPLELENAVLEASSIGQIETVEGLLCGALKTLKVNRLKPDPLVYLTLIGLAKAKPDLFQLKAVTEVGLEVLNAQRARGFKSHA